MRRLAELRFQHEESQAERRRSYRRIIGTPVWYIGIVAAFGFSFTYFVYIPSIRISALLIYILSLILFLEIWRYPYSKSIPELLRNLQCEAQMIKGIVLVVAIPLTRILILLGFLALGAF